MSGTAKFQGVSQNSLVRIHGILEVISVLAPSPIQISFIMQIFEISFKLLESNENTMLYWKCHRGSHTSKRLYTHLLRVRPKLASLDYFNFNKIQVYLFIQLIRWHCHKALLNKYTFWLFHWFHSCFTVTNLIPWLRGTVWHVLRQFPARHLPFSRYCRRRHVMW